MMCYLYKNSMPVKFVQTGILGILHSVESHSESPDFDPKSDLYADCSAHRLKPSPLTKIKLWFRAHIKL
jgi:hypothetical protein